MNLDSHLPSICVLRLPAKRRQQLPPAVDAIVHYVEEIGWRHLRGSQIGIQAGRGKEKKKNKNINKVVEKEKDSDNNIDNKVESDNDSGDDFDRRKKLISCRL